MNQQKYFLVTGCARSGTTILSRIINLHPAIYCSIERLNPHLKFNTCSVTSKQFEIDSCLAGFAGEAKANLSEKIENAIFIGDKSTIAYRHFEELSNAISPSPFFIFIIRNIFDVASSFNVRSKRQDSKWRVELDYKIAVEEWNASLVNAISAQDAGIPIHVVQYEHLFNKITLENIFSYFHLTCTEELLAKINLLEERGKMIQHSRVQALSGLEKKYILINANIDAYKDLIGVI